MRAPKAFLIALIFSGTVSAAETEKGMESFAQRAETAKQAMGSPSGMSVAVDFMRQHVQEIIAASRRCFERKENAISYAFVANLMPDGTLKDVAVAPDTKQTRCIGETIATLKTDVAPMIRLPDSGFPIHVDMPFKKDSSFGLVAP